MCQRLSVTINYNKMHLYQMHRTTAFFEYKCPLTNTYLFIFFFANLLLLGFHYKNKQITKCYIPDAASAIHMNKQLTFLSATKKYE